MKNGGRKDKQKYDIQKILKEVIENEFKKCRRYYER